MKLRLKKAHFKRFSALALGLLMVFSFQNCADQSFSDAPQKVISTGGPNCRNVLETITTPIEMVFIVDTSGSNFQDGSNPGTDPNKVLRAGSIQAFLDKYKNKSNFSWSLAHFANSQAKTIVANANASSMNSAIQTLLGVSDSGNTPYEAALNRSKELVQNDPNPNNQKKYLVVFWSDGMPNPSITDSDLEDKVEEVIGVHSGRVTMNTVYYYNAAASASASNRLKTMAQVGGGNFLEIKNSNVGTVFDISDLVLVPGVVCD